MRKALLLLVVVMAVSLPASAAEETENKGFDAKVRSVSVFKNGYGFFTVEGTADVKDGQAQVSLIPSASLGTWWFYAPAEGTDIESVVAGKRRITKENKVTSLSQLLEANIGREAVVETEDANYAGVIVAAPASHTVENARGWDIILRAKEHVVSVRGSEIKSVKIAEASEVRYSELDEGFVKLTFEGAPDGKVPVGCQFLQKGIRWIPSYRLDLGDDSASLVLQAEVINDIHDLDSATLELVAGVPSFVVGELLSPLARVGRAPNLSEYFKLTAKPEEDRTAFSNYMPMSRGGMYASHRTTSDPSVFTVERTLDTRRVSDLSFYTKEGVTLKAGERASLGILKAALPFTDIYKWDVADRMIKYRTDYRDIYKRYVDGEFKYKEDMSDELSEKLDRLTRQDVADHFVRLVNSSDKPLTSGPVLIFSKGDVLAQGIIYYTPAGGTADLRVTGAPDVRVSQNEEETAREQAALTNYGNQYDRVDVRTALTVKNFKDKPIHMVVVKSFDGKVDEASDAAAVSQDTAELASVNPHTRVEWEFDLESGAEKTLVVTYWTFVRE